MESLSKRIIYLILTLISACSIFTNKSTSSLEEKKIFARDNCVFSEEKSIRVKADVDPKYNFAPFIKCQVKNTEYIQFFDKKYLHYEIKDAVKVPHSKTFFVIFDYGIEGGLAEVPLLKSNDNGQSWMEVSKIKKTHFSDLIKEIKFSTPLLGTVQIEKEEKVLFLHTKDGGKTWSKASH